MTTKLATLLSAALVSAVFVLPAAAGPLELWYAQPASKWTEALPVGNGRVGAMIFGGVTEEHLQFNESTVWTGQPHEYQHAGAAKFLSPMRTLLNEGGGVGKSRRPRRRR